MPNKPPQPELLKSWKEISTHMNSSVRTVQRYERYFGLPVRRPAGKMRGAVMATRAEIDAWVAASPIRESFRLSRLEQEALARRQKDRLDSGVHAMKKLKDQMLELRKETRTALNQLMDRLSTVRTLIPPRPQGYEPLINMDMMDVDMMNVDTMDTDWDRRLHPEGGIKSKSVDSVGGRKSAGRRRGKASLPASRKVQ